MIIDECIKDPSRCTFYQQATHKNDLIVYANLFDVENSTSNFPNSRFPESVADIKINFKGSIPNTILHKLPSSVLEKLYNSSGGVLGSPLSDQATQATLDSIKPPTESSDLLSFDSGLKIGQIEEVYYKVKEKTLKNVKQVLHENKQFASSYFPLASRVVLITIGTAAFFAFSESEAGRKIITEAIQVATDHLDDKKKK
uniref:hypothetical protein n=1 Tax=Nitzschia dissipata TaxID=303402 RepID=UPI00202813D2|nr:hypothetical protein NDD97_mgp16 [Nitzschia dissipata]QYB23069.1 hypothetical protein [Nitzschia dissipata]